MSEIMALHVTGYKHQPVPTTFVRQATASNHLGIILPGYLHTADRAELYYAGRALQEQGADLLRVEYTYNETDFMQRSQKEQAAWLSTDVRAACAAGLAQRAYDRITLVGKSIGTMAMGHLMADPRFHKANCIWLTPILTLPWLRAQIAQAKPRSLFIIGTADRFYKAAYLDEVVQATQGQSMVIEGAAHNLEIEGDIAASLDALVRIITEIQHFITQ